MADNETSYPIYNQYAYKDGVGWVMMGASDGSSGATIQINDGTVRNLNTLVINRLTRAEFEALTNPSPDQLYIITDDVTYATVNDLPQPGNTTPQKDGTGSAGSASTYSRSDHVHPAEIPSQTNNSGKFLTTNGSAVSWATVDALPSQTNNSGKYLTTNGSVASWSTVTVPTKTSDLTNDSGYITMSDVPAAGETNQNAYTTIKVGSTDVTSNSKTGTFTVTAGTGIGLTPNTSSKSMEIKNTGVTAIAESENNGKLSVTQNGETTDVTIHGLGTAAYQATGHFYETTESHSAHQVLAAPSGSAGVATFRALVASDIPALSYVPTSRTINGKALSSNISLTASDVSAVAASSVGTANGVAELDSNGLVPSSQLPSYVDDVVEYAATTNFPASGESGKIYVATGTGKIYRWSGTQYTEISASLALGETSSTAYRGDRGKTAYDHATETRLTTAKSEGLYKISTTAEGHIGSATAVAKADITALGIPAQDTTYTFDGTYNASTNKAATQTTVTNAINGLDVSNITGFGAGKTLSTLTETNGKISATFQDISITKSQITDFPTSLAPTAHTHTVSITPKTSSIYQITSIGSVTAGSAGSVTTLDLTKFNGGTFTPGTDSFTAAAFQTGFYSVGSATTPAVINTTKFSGGSFTQGSDTFTAAKLNSGFYTAGSATTPAVINTAKFSGGSFSPGTFTGGSFSQGSDAFSAATLVMSMDSTDTKKCIISFGGGTFTQGSDSFTAATHAADSFSAASFSTGFYTAGTKGSPTTLDLTKFSGGAFTQGSDTFSAASFSTGFYTAGTKGTPTTLTLSKFSGGSFTQGSATFNPASFGTGFYSVGTPATPTVVTLPTRASVTVWTGVSSAVANANS